MDPLAAAWNATRAALPDGWRLEGLRCTSTGLAPNQRDDRWRAEACGPEGACVTVESDAPEGALLTLRDRVLATE